MPNERKTHSFKIMLNEYNGGLTPGKIEMDGIELRNVTNIKIEAGVREVTRVTLTLFASADIRLEAAKLTEMIGEP